MAKTDLAHALLDSHSRRADSELDWAREARERSPALKVGFGEGFPEEGASELNFKGCQSWPGKRGGKRYRQRHDGCVPSGLVDKLQPEGLEPGPESPFQPF